MLCRMLVARLNLDLQHQPQIGQHVAVIGMRGPPRFLRVVADYGSFLMAVERFHRRVDIKNPGFAQQRPSAIVELFLQPGSPGFGLDLAQCPTDRVLADHLGHPKQWWIDRVAAQRRDVGVAPMPASTDNITVPSMSRFDGALGLVRDSGHPATQASNNPPCFRYSMKNGSWPSGVIDAPSPFSHST